jgi:hypothetical protein
MTEGGQKMTERLERARVNQESLTQKLCVCIYIDMDVWIYMDIHGYIATSGGQRAETAICIRL